MYYVCISKMEVVVVKTWVHSEDEDHGPKWQF